MKKRLTYFLHMIRTKVMLLFAVMMAILLLLLLIFGSRLERLALDRLAETDSGLLRYYAGALESEFSAVKLFFTEQRLQQGIYLRVESAQDELEQYMAAYEIRQLFDNSLYETEFLNAAFLYCRDTNLLIQCSYNLDSEAESELAATVREQIGNGGVESAYWTRLFAGGTPYLCYTIPIHDSWIGGLVNPDNLLARVGIQKIEAFSSILLLDGSARPLGRYYDQEEADAIQAAVKQGAEEIALGGKNYALVWTKMADDTFYLAGLVDQDEMRGQFATESVAFLIAALTLLAIGIGLLVLLWRSLVTPLTHITEGMRELQQGNFSYQLKEEESSEFAQITTTFNQVGREIKQLKIAVYEGRLERQETELRFLQSQLDPHFLINCLNNLRTLVLQGRVNEFQVMLVQMGTYLRGTMTMQRTIPLEQELRNVAAYVQLQKIRYQDRFQVEVSVAEELISVPVPVHIVQTFVENAIKYGLSGDGPLEITVTGKLAEECGDALILEVTDNGPGFTPQVLEMLRGKGRVVKDGRECIGIANAAQRLRLQFGESGTVDCSNRDIGGASVRLTIPIREEDL